MRCGAGVDQSSYRRTQTPGQGASAINGPIFGSAPNRKGVSAVFGRNPSSTPATYIYLRTPQALEYCADDLLDDLYEEWTSNNLNEHVLLLCPMGHSESWEDGIVFGIWSELSPAEIAKALMPALEKFDAWAIVDFERRECMEWIGGGPVSSYFKFLQAFNATPPIAQLFLGFNDPDRVPEREIEAIRRIYGSTKCVAVFHLRNGRVLFINSSEPASIIWRRIERIAQRIDYVSGLDATGSRFCKQINDACWELISLEDLMFGPDRDEEEDDGDEEFEPANDRGIWRSPKT
jgi:hypothetical protein